ncbi:MAG: bifunctional hydroxymethylpyrimidine kinase/phosphomethylpyrimidine kinase, partial [Deltaproteobacteria bacterium]|nr:bifunctional hydroxymethylpyrimidine kinase/phosphomethylpyrimidine kinase [Deltaproteobacteria bacterium]
VVSAIGVDAVKTGMLVNAAIVQVVSQKIRQYRLRRVVVDPVMVAKNGESLLSPAAEGILKETLIPLVYLLTPNIPEAEVLIGKKIRNGRGVKEAARTLQRMGARNVLIKGGHLPGDPLDVLFDGRNFHEFKGPRLTTPHTHGTGCTLSAAIAVELARGRSLLEAVEKAKGYITLAIQAAYPLGHGRGPVNHYIWVAREIERYPVIRRLNQAFQSLQDGKIGSLCPEAQSNLGYALPYARGPEEVAAFPGRFVWVGREIRKVADPEFGASRHIAKIVLTAMSHDPAMRSAMNIRYGEDVLARAKKAGLQIAHFDRKDEPSGLKRKEGSSLSWGVHQALKEAKKMPDIIYDRGAVGKEPMIRVLGKDPQEVVAIVLRLL